MKKARIALIDSGIKSNTFQDCNNITQKYYCSSDHVITKVNSENLVTELHGSICAGIIQKFNPDADVISIQVVKEGHLGNIIDIVEALKFCYKIHVDVISMSLGTINLESAIYMYKYIEASIKSNVFIVSPIGKFGRIAFPGNFERVLGVDAETDLLNKNSVKIRYIPACQKEVIFVNGSQKLVMKDGTEYMTPNYSSFAVPVISGIVSKFISECEKLRYESIKERLNNYVLF